MRHVIRCGRITYLLGQGVYSIGRHPECSIALDDPEVSRRHAAIVGSGEKFFLVDLRSSNGVFVNDKRTLECSLDSGDEIVLGQTRLDFFSEGEDKPFPLDAASRKGDKKKAKAKESASVGQFLANNLQKSHRLRAALEDAFRFLRFVGSLPKSDILINRCLTIARELVRADRVYLLLFDGEKEVERHIEEVTPREGEDIVDREVTQMARHLIKKDKTQIYVNEVMEKEYGDDERFPCLKTDIVRSGLGAPMKVEDGSICGALLVFNLLPTERAFEEVDEEIIGPLAESLAVALQNIKYFEETTE